MPTEILFLKEFKFFPAPEDFLLFLFPFLFCVAIIQLHVQFIVSLGILLKMTAFLSNGFSLLFLFKRFPANLD